MTRKTLLQRCVVVFGAALAFACAAPQPPARHAAEPGVASADVALLQNAYRERLRLGLGSPFRLMELALRDERLGAARAATAELLLTQLERGDAYQLGPLPLIAAGMDSATALRHFALIEQVMEGAASAAAAEQAVSRAYRALEAEGAIRPVQSMRAIRMAGLLRDRRLARADADRLRAAARQLATPISSIIIDWRRQHRLLVEQPLLRQLDADAQAEADRLALLLTGGLRAIPDVASTQLRRTIETGTSLLSESEAERLPGMQRNEAPQSAVVITLQAIARAHEGTHSQLATPAWQALLAAPGTEEQLAGALTLIQESAADTAQAHGIAVEAASALRTYAQQTVSLNDSITASSIRKRFNVQVRFVEAYPERTRKQTLNALSNALDDLRLAVPTLQLSGLVMEIGPVADPAAHVAFHDPRARVLRIDPAQLGGTVAHEIAHDLDWQLARRRYRTAASYATEYALRRQTVLAPLVQAMARGVAALDVSPEKLDRPAEIFARRFEGYVVAALADAGRMNGDLSSVQTAAVTGYGSAIVPAAPSTESSAFVALLAEAAAFDAVQRANAERLSSTQPAAASCAPGGNPFLGTLAAVLGASDCGH